MPLPLVTDRLLERGGQMATLDDALDRARGRRGSVVVVGGEAGIGKSSLVAAWLHSLAGEDARILVGWCDDFLTGRTLGPLHDIAREVDGALASAVDDADTSGVLEALLTLLDDPLRPTVLVLEDVHWADEATLDVIRFVGRRVATRPAVLVLTFRDDELGRDHPLSSVLAALSTAPVVRAFPSPLSREAIAELLECSLPDAAAVAQVTGGNPFFVTEVARAEEGQVPLTVADTVLGRVGQLSDPARRALEGLSVFPGTVDLDLARAVVGDLGLLSPAERRGLLVATVDGVRFRHELVRRAVEGALTTTERLTAHRHGLEALQAMPTTDPTEVLHQAVGAGAHDVVTNIGPPAAFAAFRAGAHRQADAIQRQVLAHPDHLDPAIHARLLEERAWTLYNLHRFEDAVAMAGDAIALREQEAGDGAGLVGALLVRGRMAYIANHPGPARRDLERAVALVATITDPELRAEVAVNNAVMLALTYDEEGARATVDDALAAAEAVERPDLVVLGMNARAVVRSMAGDAEGAVIEYQRALEIGKATGLLEPTARTYTNVVEALHWAGLFPEALAIADEAIAFFDDHDFVAHRYSVVAKCGLIELYQGRWDDAEATFAEATATVDPDQVGVIGALVYNGQARLAVWRGDPNVDEALERAWSVALATGAAEYITPVGALRIEYAWLHDHPDLVDETVALALLPTAPIIHRGMLLRMLQLSGHADGLDIVPEDYPEPFRSGLAGDWQTAAARWADFGGRHREAMELASSGEVEPTLRALEILDDLGAGPAARWVRSRLRDLGVRSIPRGPLPATRENPAGLTPRQVEVLQLLAEGLTNAEIADRLVLSVRTVDHHVSAILEKLGVASRREAAAAAPDLGIA